MIVVPDIQRVPSHRLHERNEALFPHIVHLAVQVLEIGWIDPVVVRADMSGPFALAGKQEGPVSLLVVHVLGRGFVARLVPGLPADVYAVIILRIARVAINIPARVGEDHRDGVVPIPFHKLDRFLEPETRARHIARVDRLIFERVSPRAGGPPGVGQHEERCSVSVGESVAACTRANDAPPVGILLFLRFGPVHRVEAARVTIKPWVLRVGMAGPGPGPRPRRHHADSEGATPIPEPVDLLVEIRPDQLDPDHRVGVRILVAVMCLKRDLHLLPHVHICCRLILHLILHL